ncbi:Interferon-related developmental regulator family protein / IFRD protein family [Citrus sinensis]|uniref:Interferon-related developmental regulator family protein / IFRD protein family n=1 Tax=Citrus sinensis TaxID=2711 RepID=A0ACB8KN06_CITSI|nr:Interferon-related developmental regulator family protein / IFRD protein family [Citrus sinensis]
MLDSDDDNSSVSSTSTMRSDRMSVSGTEEVQLEKDTLLDEALDALYEKRGSTREKALSSIIEAFNNTLQHQFVEKKFSRIFCCVLRRFATLLHQCLSSIKRGSSREIALASHAIGLLALTVGYGENSREILEESVAPISQALKSGFDSSKIASLLECLAVITFVGGNDPEETERTMQIMWQIVHPKLGSNVVATRPSAPIITAMVSAWSFLLTTMDGCSLDSKKWQQSISYFSTLLDKDDRSIRIAAGEALALILETGSLEKFSSEAKGSNDGSREEYIHLQGLKGKILNQVRNLSVEAGGKGSAKKDLTSQRNLFKDILEFLELNFLKHFLGGGFVKHMQENEFLHDVFGFTPKRKYLSVAEHHISSTDKRMYKSPNSVVNKARTQKLNKQRMLSEGRNVGHYAVNVDDDEV